MNITEGTLCSSTIDIDAIEGLEELAGYEDGYLHFTQIPSRTRKVLADA